MSARQKNAPKGGENFKISSAGKPAMGGKGSVSKVIGPKTATTTFSGPRLGPAAHTGPAGAPYHNTNSSK